MVWASLASELIPAHLGGGEESHNTASADAPADPSGHGGGWSLLCFAADFLAVEEEAVNGVHLFVVLARVFTALLGSLPEQHAPPASEQPHEPPYPAMLRALSAAAHVASLLSAASATSASAARPVRAAAGEARALFIRYYERILASHLDGPAEAEAEAADARAGAGGRTHTAARLQLLGSCHALAPHFLSPQPASLLRLACDPPCPADADGDADERCYAELTTRFATSVTLFAEHHTAVSAARRTRTGASAPSAREATAWQRHLRRLCLASYAPWPGAAAVSFGFVRACADVRRVRRDATRCSDPRVSTDALATLLRLASEQRQRARAAEPGAAGAERDDVLALCSEGETRQLVHAAWRCVGACACQRQGVLNLFELHRLARAQARPGLLALSRNYR